MNPCRLRTIGDGLLTNHLAPLLADQGEAVSWLTGRLSGEPARGDCTQLGALP